MAVTASTCRFDHEAIVSAAKETTRDVLLRIWKGLSPRRSNVRHRRIGGVENITL